MSASGAVDTGKTENTTTNLTSTKTTSNADSYNRTFSYVYSPTTQIGDAALRTMASASGAGDSLGGLSESLANVSGTTWLVIAGGFVGLILLISALK